MDQQPGNEPTGDAWAASTDAKLSYKFQRLREKLRAAIASGELSGKLPGERQLAKRFHVNAKTLSKALTDLAAEGLLDRSIGRGTFVKSASDANTSINSIAAERWLVVCDLGQQCNELIAHLRQINSNLQVVSDFASLRPSMLTAVRAAIVISHNVPDAFLRDLVVRNIPVVLVGREPSTYSVNAVLIDRALGAACLVREMLALGHRRFAVVEEKGQTTMCESARRAAALFASNQPALLDSVFADDVFTALDNGATAILCDSQSTARKIRGALENRAVAVPGQVSIGAIGSSSGEHPCSGYFLHDSQTASTVADLLRDTQVKRPTTMWMTGAFADAGTIARPTAFAIDKHGQGERYTAVAG